MADRNGRILIVDDDRIVLDSLGEFLRLEGYVVDTADGGDKAIDILEKNRISLVITDVNMPDTGGFELLRIIRKQYPDVMVMVLTGYGTIESAVEAIKMGAFEYLTKPIIDDEVRLAVERALKQQSLLRENRSLRKLLDVRFSLGSMIGHDYKMLKVFDLIEAVADSKTNVLIQGESGTGKSLAARVIHHLSAQCKGPFVEVSCGAIPEALLESELFGHVRGAFTGAISDKSGKFRVADGGTIFLDEISSASPALQVKLLRVLQERQFEPVGSNKTEMVDVRVLLASNEDLAQAVKNGTFRQDLYYRVNVVSIHLPSLQERISDIPRLATAFLEKYCRQAGKEILGFTDEALQALQCYHWPGNVRELENAVERAVVLTKSRQVQIEDLPPAVLECPVDATAGNRFQPMSLKRALEEPEKRVIKAALEANNWNRQVTADVLEINRTTLYKKMKRYRLDAAPQE